MRKKILIGILALLLVAGGTILAVSLLADTPSAVAICYADQADESSLSLRQQLEKQLEANGYQLLTAHAAGDPATQTGQILQLAEDADLFLIEPVTVNDDLHAALSQTELPAVFMGCSQALSSNQTSCVGAEPAQAAQLLSQMAVSLPNGGDVNGDGTVTYLLICDAPAQHRADTLTASFSGQEVHQLANEVSDGTVEGAKQLCQQQLSTYGTDIEVVFCIGDSALQGASQAIAESGWQLGLDFHLLGIGIQPESVQLVQNRQASGMVYLDTQALFDAITDCANAFIAEQRQPMVHIEFQTVTAPDAQ